MVPCAAGVANVNLGEFVVQPRVGCCPALCECGSLARPGVVFSRAQLEEKLFSWKDEVSSNAVEVYIHGVRKKLGAEFIQTVRGLGYLVPRA